MLQNPTVDTAVFEVARGGILREGLGYDRNDVAVVTNVAGDHLGLGGIDDRGPAGQRQGRRGGRGAAQRDRACSTRTIRSSPGWRAGRDGKVIYFSMATEKGKDGWDRVDTHCGRGGAAMIVQETEDGELLALRQGSRDRCRSSTPTSSPPRSMAAPA